MFNNIAPSYDLLNHLLSLNIDHYWRWRATRLAPPRGEAPILDLCTGTGDRGLAEMVRVTRPGGQVAVLEFSQPRGRIFGGLYRFYFRHILPRIGQAISRSKDNAYRYLPASVQEFPDGEALAERLRRHGLREVRWHSLTFGVATLYVGTKTAV